jgi:hypothetical protein
MVWWNTGLDTRALTRWEKRLWSGKATSIV